MTEEREVIKRCAACRKEKPVSQMKVCMHAQMHNYVCDSKCMNDFYNPPKKPAQLPSQGGEAVEVVATVEAYGGKWAGIHWGECIGSTEDPERQLMTVAQHQRILAAATHPADQVADDLTMVKVPRDPDQNVFDFIEVAYEAAAPGDEGRDVWTAIINFYHPPITGQKAVSSQDQRDIYEDGIKAISALLNGGRS